MRLAIPVDTVVAVKRNIWIPRSFQTCRRARFSQGQGVRAHAGLRPSLTCAVRADPGGGRSGRRNDQSPIEQRNMTTVEAQAGMAMAGSNRLPIFKTPKQRTSSLRIAATTICLGLRRPALLRRATSAATAGLKRMADNAGIYNAER